MKKIILLLAITISALSAFAIDSTIDHRILKAFEQEFSTAKDVTWSRGTDYYKAEFTFNGICVNAFYNKDGELMGLTRYITSLDLPLKLQANLKKSHSGFWIKDLFEVTMSESTAYYITLEDADNIVVMKASADGDWSIYKKVKKA